MKIGVAMAAFFKPSKPRTVTNKYTSNYVRPPRVRLRLPRKHQEPETLTCNLGYNHARYQDFDEVDPDFATAIWDRWVNENELVTKQRAERKKDKSKDKVGQR